jgi:hypothetical protein
MFTNNNYVYVILGFTLLITVIIIPISISESQKEFDNFATTCKNLYGEVLEGRDTLICIKPGSILTTKKEIDNKNVN